MFEPSFSEIPRNDEHENLTNARAADGHAMVDRSDHLHDDRLHQITQAAAPSSIEVPVAEVEQKDVPIYANGSNAGRPVEPRVLKAQVSGYLLTRSTRKGSS